MSTSLPVLPNHPYSFDISALDGTMSAYDQHLTRRLSDLSGLFADQAAFAQLIEKEDELLYQVFHSLRPDTAGELPSGITILHPGRVGNEYFMTKGHFHAVLETGEIYYGLKGQGMIVMETPEGEWAVEEIVAGRVVYIPPRWAHRSVNTGDEDFVFFFAYPGNAGHDYGSIEKQGFRKLVVAGENGPEVVDNPKWKVPEER